MTIEEILHSRKETLTCADVAEVLHIDPQTLRLRARDSVWRQQLGFPVIVSGVRVRIPRRPFLTYLGYEPLNVKKEGKRFAGDGAAL